ncbi:uroporphyrinogen-III C-methyltransferase [Paucibacter sp. APW11]|uniref:Uroporphyrinogen-III C-methyltransferase n=1 Tax=Roseateles aquae TaxID=3077235 RepID=A0ABU3P858_9BURK|nr:uroporphyrinogen-III C-methyltransferase [Paucibacter sp. APW11]MDT8998415.1 uroporphyrinogen-III C-methyltransferase [Paucibacter sp. APW11]
MPALEAAPTVATAGTEAAASPRGLSAHVWPITAAVLALCSLSALGLAWMGNSRLQALEQELVRRQASSQGDASEARAAARQAQDLTRDTAAKVALLDARLAEVALQRGQLEELMQALSRSRDENVVGDVDAAIRVALQQTTITGSAEPLVAALRQADERLARHKQPRLEGVRRAVVRDLDRVKAVSVIDVATLAIKLDEVVRLLDELPLLSAADKSSELAALRQARAEKPAAKPAPKAEADEGWQAWLNAAQTRWSDTAGQVWQEAKSLLRVTRINQPEAMLIAPEQSYFLRENLKLRLLNARLALMSRQFDTAQSDLRDTLNMLDRYFDGRSRKVVAASELLRQVQGQARQVVVPRPDDTLAALAAAGR